MGQRLFDIFDFEEIVALGGIDVSPPHEEIDFLLERLTFAGADRNLHPSVPRRNPRQTEDGIPIRKIYIANLPPKTTRSELFELFVPYGQIKSCWLKNVEREAGISPYAFITFIDPEDAYKALQAPAHKRSLRGRNLRVSAADSWHQPRTDADGNVIWSNKKPAQPDENSTMPTEKAESSHSKEPDAEVEPEYNIMDILNPDCMAHIMSYLSIWDLIRSEAVSKRWRDMVQDYMLSIRTFRTSSLQCMKIKITTATLRQLLLRIGHSITALHIDDRWPSLNDRTAHIVGKFCPNLEHLFIHNMQTRNWNPVIYCCKHLQSISFHSCNKIDDSRLLPLVGPTSPIESLTLLMNTDVTGSFLNTPTPPKLRALTFYNCTSLQESILSDAFSKMSTLKCLTLNQMTKEMWRGMPAILSSLPNLEELNLCDSFGRNTLVAQSEDLIVAMEKLTELRVLVLAGNLLVDDDLIARVTKSCTKLRKLDILGCHQYSEGVTAKGLKSLGQNCSQLQNLDISYLSELNEGVEALAGCSELRCLIAHCDRALTDAPLVQCLMNCHQLEVVDVRGCQRLTLAVVEACVSELKRCPRPMKLFLAGTSVEEEQAADLPSHPLLKVNLKTRVHDRFSVNPPSSPSLGSDYDDFDDDDLLSDDSFDFPDEHRFYYYQDDDEDDDHGMDWDELLLANMQDL